MTSVRKSTPSGTPDPQTIDIIGRLRNRLEKGYGAERRLVKYILSNPQVAANAPIADIAKGAEVSEPTITRLARSMGLSGTRDIRFHLAQALATGGAYMRNPMPTPDNTTPASNEIAAVALGAHAAIDQVMMGISRTGVTTIADRLANAGKVLICGTGGGSSMAAVELHNRLFRLGVNATSQTDPQLQRMNAAVLSENDVIIGFSISGRARSILDALLIARQYGAHTVVVSIQNSPIAGNADTFLPLHVQEDENLYKPSSTRYGLLAMVDVLSMATAHAIGSDVIEPLRRVRQSLASQDMLDPKMPIGD